MRSSVLWCGLLLGSLAQSGRLHGAHQPAAARSADMVVILLQDGRLLVVDVESGAVLGERQLPRESTERVGSFALAGARAEVYASMVDANAGRTRIVAVELASLRLRSVATIRDSVGYPLLDVGPRTGALYAAADHQLHAVVLDPLSGAERQRVSLARDPPGDWRVYAMKVAPDERRLYLSFHGGSTGVDWLDIGAVPARVCDRSRAGSRVACIGTHGNFAPFRGGIVAATGEGVMVVDSSGARVAEYDVGLAPANHFMEFALDTLSGIAYGIGSCLYAGGLTATHLDSASGPRVAPVLRGNEQICGGTVLLSPDRRFLVVSRDRRPSDPPVGELAIVNLNRGAVRRRVPISGIVARS